MNLPDQPLHGNNRDSNSEKNKSVEVRASDEVQASHMQPRLSLWYFWFATGLALVAIVIYLSVANFHVPQIPSTLGDKINHCIAYGTLMLWFGQLFRAHRSRLVLALLLIALGIAMEFIQGVLPYRFFDWFDMLANVSGVLMSMCLLLVGAEKFLLWFEERVFS